MISVRRHLEKAHGKIHDAPKRRRPPPPPPRLDLNQSQGDVKPAPDPHTGLQQHQQHQTQQHMEQQPQNHHQQQQRPSDCQQQQQQDQNNQSKNNPSQVGQDCKQADEYNKHQSLRGGQEVPLIHSQPPPLLAVVPPPPAHDPPPAHAQHVHGSHKHYSHHGDPGVHVSGMHVPSTSHHSGQLSSHHITAIPQYHGATPDRPVFPERSHMDRPMFPPHNERDPSRPGFSTTHNPHGHDRDPRPVFPGNERPPLLPSDQIMERAMRGDGQFFYPLNLIQQAPMHFNVDQLLHMASQSDGNAMPVPHPPNSISQ